MALFRKKCETRKKKTVTCTICKRTQTFPGNTSNMFVHLKNYHPDIYQEIAHKISKKPQRKRRESNSRNGLLNEVNENDGLEDQEYNEGSIDSDSTVLNGKY